MSKSHSIQERREQAIGEPQRRKRRHHQRRPRVFAAELPAGAPLPRLASFWVPVGTTGVYTRDRQLALAARKAAL
jgi:hypothetical protein